MQDLLRLLAKAQLILLKAQDEKRKYDREKERHSPRSGGDWVDAQRVDTLCREFASVTQELVPLLRETLGDVVADLRPLSGTRPTGHGFQETTVSEEQFMQKVCRAIAGPVEIQLHWNDSEPPTQI